MPKEIKSLYCPQCKKQKKFENNPKKKTGGQILGCLLLAFIFILAGYLFWSVLSVISILFWIGSLCCLLSIFVDEKESEKFYCSECGTIIEVKTE